MSTQIASLLKYANLQMAAEAYLSNFGNQISEVALTEGNKRSSRFPTALSKQLASDRWTVVEHLRNTDTGFSGTLFRYDVQPDPTRGLVPGELVLSFRFTDETAFLPGARKPVEATVGGSP